MPAINETNRVAESYGELGKDYLVIADTETLPCEIGPESSPCVHTQIWEKNEEGNGYIFTGRYETMPEYAILGSQRMQDYLSVRCSASIGKSVGVIRMKLIA